MAEVFLVFNIKAKRNSNQYAGQGPPAHPWSLPLRDFLYVLVLISYVLHMSPLLLLPPWPPHTLTRKAQRAHTHTHTQGSESTHPHTHASSAYSISSGKNMKKGKGI